MNSFISDFVHYVLLCNLLQLAEYVSAELARLLAELLLHLEQVPV